MGLVSICMRGKLGRACEHFWGAGVAVDERNTVSGEGLGAVPPAYFVSSRSMPPVTVESNGQAGYLSTIGPREEGTQDSACSCVCWVSLSCAFRFKGKCNLLMQLRGPPLLLLVVVMMLLLGLLGKCPPVFLRLVSILIVRIEVQRIEVRTCRLPNIRLLSATNVDRTGRRHSSFLLQLRIGNAAVQS